MKYIKISICIFSFTLLSLHDILAQSPDIPLNLDSSEIYDIGQLLQSVFGSLDTSLYPSGIIYDRTSKESKLTLANGSDTSTEIDYNNWLVMYRELRWAHTDTSRMPEVYKVFKSAFNKYDSLLGSGTVVVPLGCLYYKYEELMSGAVDSGYIYSDSIRLLSTPGAPNPFTTRHTFSIVPMIDTISVPTLLFYMSDQIIFSNISTDQELIYIDFDDGNGYQQVYKNTGYSIQYSIGGMKHIKTMLITGNDTLYSNSTFFLETFSNSLTGGGCGIDIGTNTFINSPVYGNKNIEAEVKIWLGCGHTQIVKPVILVSGYNPFRINSLDHYFEKYNSNDLLCRLLDHGYDIFIVRFKNGADYVENNAAVLIKIIHFFNLQMFANGSHFENVIIGYSAGALAARNALNKMEYDNQQNPIAYPDHHTRLYVSYDGEHQGANFILGVQHTLMSFANDPSTPLGALIDILLAKQFLDSPLAKQFLYYHYSQTGTQNNPGQGSHWLHNQLMNDFDNFDHAHTKVSGYPAFTRNMGIADGSSNATGTNMSQNELLFSDLQVSPSALSFITAKYQSVKYRAIKQGGNKIFSRTKWWIPIVGNPFPVMWQRRYTGSGAKPVDMAPGSTFKQGWHNIMKFVFAGALLPGVPFVISNHKDCFVPTVSALDINTNTNNLGYNLYTNQLLRRFASTSAQYFYGYPHLGHPTSHYNITPFNVLFADVFNTPHAAEDETDILTNLLIDQEIAPEYLVIQNRSIGKYRYHYSADFSSSFIYAGRNATSEARSVAPNNINIDDFTPFNDVTVEPNSTVDFKATNEIHLKPGFHAKAGCHFRAHIGSAGCTSGNRQGGDIITGRGVEYSYDNGQITDDVDTIVSNDEMKSDALFRVYPNPATRTVVVELPDDQQSSICIYSTAGVLVYRKETVHSIEQLSLNLPQGLYILAVRNAQNLFTAKLVIAP